MGFTGSSDLLVRLDADPKGFQRGLKKAVASSRELERTLARKEAALKSMHGEMETVGQGFLAFGAAGAIGLGLVAKAAIEWESAWAGVTKTVDGSPEQMAALEDELRELTKVLPATHTEIAAVAEAAGQLGIKRKDVAGFTKVMVDLGETTNLTADQAAMSLAKFMNIMQTAPQDVERLGATLVDLGNKGASTEADIMEMAMRIAGAGNQIGLSEAEVLAFAGTLSSLGIEAEAGGSAISTIFVKMQTAVSDGGESLESFARIAGISSSEFASAWNTDAAGAIDMVVHGLSNMSKQGVDLFGVLDELGIKEIRQRDAILRMAGAGNLLTEQLSIANGEWLKGTALVQEAEKRYGTTASQIAIAKNHLNDFAISLGDNLLPVISGVVKWLGGMADFFASLPGPVQAVLVILGTLATTVGLVAGVALIAVPKIAEFNEALSNMDGKGARVAQRGLAGLASFFTSKWGAVLGIAVIALGAFASTQAQSKARIAELTGTLDEQTGAITSNTRAWIVNELEQEGSLWRAKELGISTDVLVDAILGEKDALEEVRQNIADAKAAHEGYSEEQLHTSNISNMLEESLADLGVEVEEAKDSFERKQEAMGETTTTTQDLTAAENLLAESMGVSADLAGEARDAITELDQALNQLLTSLFGVDQAERKVADAIAAATEQAAENGGQFDQNTDAGRRNADTIESLIGDYFGLIQAHAEAGASSDELAKLTSDLKQQFIEEMEAAGFAEDEIEKYAESFDSIPDTVKSILELEQKLTGNFGGSGTGNVGKKYFYQHGGLVTGGPPGIDTVSARLTNNEFVVREAATRRHLPLLRAINDGGPLPSMGGGSLHVENLHLTPIGADFSIKQVRDDLLYHLALSGGV